MTKKKSPKLLKNKNYVQKKNCLVKTKKKKEEEKEANFQPRKGKEKKKGGNVPQATAPKIKKK